MQTFILSKDPIVTMRQLDRQRLGKQRIETRQIYNCIIGKSSLGWRNHSVVKGWKAAGEEGLNYLNWYYNENITEWLNRGYNNTMPLVLDPDRPLNSFVLPQFLWSHHIDYVTREYQRLLVSKNYNYYQEIFPDIGYIEDYKINYNQIFLLED